MFSSINKYCNDYNGIKKFPILILIILYQVSFFYNFAIAKATLLPENNINNILQVIVESNEGTSSFEFLIKYSESKEINDLLSNKINDKLESSVLNNVELKENFAFELLNLEHSLFHNSFPFTKTNPRSPPSI